MTDPLSKYVPTIGLEIHAQLLTDSKMFCGCSAAYAGMPPNSQVCPVDLGWPGSLPVANAKAVESAVMAATALHCEIAPVTRFDRKNYPYPDIPKGYQISQYDTPIGRNGYVDISAGATAKRVGIIRAHLEEDTGKTIHATVDGREVSLVDYNRSGIPLLEIVSEPDITTPDEARAYFEALREILLYLGVSSGDMQEGALRADVNVSVSAEQAEHGVKVEIKNLNSFRAVERALRFEIDRQIAVLEAGRSISQETRGWDEDREVTVSQRSKEFAEDYRYFPEPDLLPLHLSETYLQGIRERMPETAAQKRAGYTSNLGLSAYDAGVLTQEPAVARFFDQTVGLLPAGSAKTVANWLTGEFLRLLSERQTTVADAKLTPAALAELVGLIDNETITTAMGKVVFEETFNSGESPGSIVEKRGLRQVSDRDELTRIVREVIEANESLASDYVHKDRKTEGPLVGKVMAATRGKANPSMVKEILESLLLKPAG